ncbi:uncharacterized protein BX664DRAFT_382885 [Halteromyces radiatus]|uniref:uncharacterized protein n=1 Tax=Halteromyces radiatus TaxID=101107 RepID=UPI002220A8E2|nr:uncharacterized protein BX664DRAFT_382885 [Halteromyces radiatus]KAI8096435.1 hypothetical protein BX664DRAFT_382885 [Halteromyces radiatus]
MMQAFGNILNKDMDSRVKPLVNRKHPLIFDEVICFNCYKAQYRSCINPHAETKQYLKDRLVTKDKTIEQFVKHQRHPSKIMKKFWERWISYYAKFIKSHFLQFYVKNQWVKKQKRGKNIYRDQAYVKMVKTYHQSVSLNKNSKMVYFL